MCTVTALPRSLLARTWRAEPLLLRVACNRDERLTRHTGLAPTLWKTGPSSVVMPIDPDSGGTWIAVNDMGVVFAILNANPDPIDGPAEAGHCGHLSRGLIIPSLVSGTTVSEALRRAQALRADRYAPFRLLLFDRYQLVECWPEAGRIRHRRSFLYGAVMRTSSGLGDAVVARPRRALFNRVLRDPVDPLDAQDRFHEHTWPGREEVSVNMRRADARTVSHTIVEVGLHTISMSYRAVDSPQPILIRVAA
jgi:uncharacterized protein with NRDE domain